MSKFLKVSVLRIDDGAGYSSAEKKQLFNGNIAHSDRMKLTDFCVQKISHHTFRILSRKLTNERKTFKQ